MNSTDSQPSVPPVEEEKKFINYQTNRIPWFIHGMWIIFAISGIAYLLKFALGDFLRWW